MTKALEGEALERAAERLAGWSVEGGALVKEMRFASFPAAFAFLTHVAMMAERMDHHPEIHNSYRTVRLRLQTHDAGGAVTERDLTLAEAIDGIDAAPRS